MNAPLANAALHAVPSQYPRLDRYDVIIVGASIAGCAAAKSLALADPERARTILVFDLHRGSSSRFSGELIHPRGAEVLDALGFLAPLMARGAAAVDGFVVHERADTLAADRVDLPYSLIPGGKSHGVAAHHQVLIEVMRNVAAAEPNVELCEGIRLVELVRDGDTVCGVVVSIGNERRTIRTDLVVGADGKASTTRKLAGIPDGRQALGFTLGLEISQPALEQPTWANVVLGAPGPMLCYPIFQRGDQIRSRLTIDLPRELPAKGSKLPDYILDAFVPYLPDGLARQVAAEVVSSARSGRLAMAPTVNLPAPPATLRGLALIGDAAGCSHPITASGMTMGLLDANGLGAAARSRTRALRGRPLQEQTPWLDASSLRSYRAAHDRYVPTRQALADAIYEAFRGEDEGSRAICKALFAYWRESESNRARSLSLLACHESRPHIFVSEYIKTARHALETSMRPSYATNYPITDRLRQVQGAAGLAADKLGLVAKVAWAQLRPEWLTP